MRYTPQPMAEVTLKCDPDTPPTRWGVKSLSYAELEAAEKEAGPVPLRGLALARDGKQSGEMTAEEQEALLAAGQWLRDRATAIVLHGLVSVDGQDLGTPQERADLLCKLRPTSLVRSVIDELSTKILAQGEADPSL